MLDFFTEEAEKNFEKAIPTKTAGQDKSYVKQSSSGAGTGGNVQPIFDKLKGLINADLVGKMKGVYSFNLTGTRELENCNFLQTLVIMFLLRCLTLH